MSEMAFMDNIETTCEACAGLRYSKEALKYTITSEHTGQTLNIAQVFDLSVRLASAFFKGTLIEDKLKPLMTVGLGYLHLNQALSTLSGGELQRMKLASHLGKEQMKSVGKNNLPDDGIGDDNKGKGKIFIIDEPTDGLHMKDVKRLIQLFWKMVEEGNSLFVIEHNIDVIKAAEYVVELGPGAGEKGGQIVFTGTPQQLRHSKNSITARYL